MKNVPDFPRYAFVSFAPYSARALLTGASGVIFDQPEACFNFLFLHFVCINVGTHRNQANADTTEKNHLDWHLH